MDGAPRLRIARGPQVGLSFPLPPGVTVVGRGNGADIMLDDATVARRHAELLRVDNRVVLRDAGSLNGTYLNGQPVTRETELTDGDEIWTGKCRMLFSDR